MFARGRRAIGCVNAHDRLDDSTSCLAAEFWCSFCRARLLAGWRCLRQSQAEFSARSCLSARRLRIWWIHNDIVRVPWVPALGMNYHLALDGISLMMVLVTGISAVSTVLFSWDVEHRQNEFFFRFPPVVAGCYGVFLSADLFAVVLNELVIVPNIFSSPSSARPTRNTAR